MTRARGQGLVYVQDKAKETSTDKTSGIDTDPPDSTLTNSGPGTPGKSLENDDLELVSNRPRGPGTAAGPGPHHRSGTPDASVDSLRERDRLRRQQTP